MAALRTKVVDGAGAVEKAAWDALANPPGAAYDPFISWDFLEALEAARCVGSGTGWQPRFILVEDAKGALVGAAPCYVKANSYGEYVFDHAWADAYHRAGGRYYPKLQIAAPFTPVPGRRLLAATPEAEASLRKAAIALAQDLKASSVHVTFCSEGERQRAEADGFLPRTGLQFHWENAGYKTFADFLAALSSGKRKTIRRERERAAEGLTLETLKGAEISKTAWDAFFDCYMDTGARKWGNPYLNRRFFDIISTRMADRLVLFAAAREGEIVATALNFLGSDAIFGRYWGKLEEELPFLHFELCYYKAIEYAIDHGLKRVEAGAQGEHKLLRGYHPVATYSAHWIAHPGLKNAVADFLERERPAVAHEIDALDEYTPFKKGE